MRREERREKRELIKGKEKKRKWKSKKKWER